MVARGDRRGIRLLLGSDVVAAAAALLGGRGYACCYCLGQSRRLKLEMILRLGPGRDALMLAHGLTVLGVVARTKGGSGLVRLGLSGYPVEMSVLGFTRTTSETAYHSDTPAPSKLIGCLTIGPHVSAQPVNKRCLVSWWLVDAAL